MKEEIMYYLPLPYRKRLSLCVAEGIKWLESGCIGNAMGFLEEAHNILEYKLTTIRKR